MYSRDDHGHAQQLMALEMPHLATQHSPSGAGTPVSTCICALLEGSMSQHTRRHERVEASGNPDTK